MAVLDFLSNSRSRSVKALYFDHGTDFSKAACGVVESFCEKKRVPLYKGSLKDNTPISNLEAFWREARYKFLESFAGPVITCHNLDDQVETYLFSALHGNPKLIPYSRNNIIRPFLTTEKIDLLSWCDRHDVPYIVDPANSDRRFMRSIIRHDLIPIAEQVNPGLKKVIMRKVNVQVKKELECQPT